MCLILLAVDRHPKYPLVLAANRDEFHARPTAPLARWTDHPDIVAGRDLQGGGTWLGVGRTGRIAAVTNYREPDAHRSGAPSRGELVVDFLTGSKPPADHLEDLAVRIGRYNGFNLLLGEPGEIWHLSNRGGEPRRLEPGIHGLSNHLLDTEWPKVARGKAALDAAVGAGAEPDPEDLFALMADRRRAPDEELPDTGIGPEWERLLSPIFITSPAYGTRSTTLVLADPDGGIALLERTHSPDGPSPAGAGTRRATIRAGKVDVS